MRIKRAGEGDDGSHITEPTLSITRSHASTDNSAAAAQFLPEKIAGLSEMRRVVKPAGRVAVSLWCDLEECPYFYSLVEAIDRHIGPETAAGLKSAFALSRADEIHHLLTQAGFGQVEMTVRQLDLPLPGLTGFVPRHISATPMATGFSQASEAAQQAVIRDVTTRLSRYEIGDHARIPFKSHLMMGRR